ncbi:MAG: DNA gyrase modulator, partial [Ilumatobacter sp.]
MIDTDVLDRVLARAVRSGAGFAEVFAEDRRSTSLAFDDGRVDRVTSGRDRGAGIRVVNGSTTGYAHTADLSETGLLAAADAAAAAAGSGSDGQRVVGQVGARDDGARHSLVATPPTEI